MLNALTVDVEEYFQVEALSGSIHRDSWSRIKSRVEHSVDRLLQLFEDFGVGATFFTLGWVAERHPQMIQRIVDNGHELASHGYAHERVDKQSPAEFRIDAERAKGLLEDLVGKPVYGYRAATFSVNESTPWFFGMLEDLGYAYSSSVYSIRHDLYGMPNASRFVYRPEPSRNLLEIPISTVEIFNRRLPCGGGGYFRLLPYAVSRMALRRVNDRDGQPCVFYLHPWEIDPDQPRVPNLPVKSRFRHYLNLARTESRLSALLTDFAWDRVDRVFLNIENGRA